MSPNPSPNRALTAAERQRLHDAVLAASAKASSQQPMPAPKLIRAVQGRLPGTSKDLVFDAIEHLRDAAALNHCRITRGGSTQDVYWPTGVPPRNISFRDLPIGQHTRSDAAQAQQQQQAPAMSKPQTPPPSQTERAVRVIVERGPMLGADVASAAKVRARDLHALLVAPIKHGRVAVRMAMVPGSAIKRPQKHYMSGAAAAEWDAGRAPGTGLQDRAQAESAEHQRMETDAEATAPSIEHDALDLIAERDRLQARVSDLEGRVYHLTQSLDAARREAHLGDLALLLIGPADARLEDAVDEPLARQQAIEALESGEAERAIIVRVLAEAEMRVDWVWW